MKKLRATCSGRVHEHQDGHFECDEITLDLDHGRIVTIRRESLGGEDGIRLFCGIDRPNSTSNARFVIRAGFNSVHLGVEQMK